jgi:hypothetical protein
VTFSRRQLLTSLGLALPAVTVMAAEANAASVAHRRHKPTKHGGVTQVSHKHHKPTSHAPIKS